MSESKQWTENDVLKLMALIHNLNAASLSDTIGDNAEPNNVEIGDTVEDTNPGPQELLEQQDRIALLRKAVKKLEPREQMVISMRYGLIDGNFRTLEECGQHFGVSRERIRQVEVRALRKLKWIIKCKYKLKQEDL